MKSENKNFLMNVGYQALTLVFPLVTVPWVSRALGVDGIGIYSYTYSIAYMFMLAGMLGVGNYGNRSIARVRDDAEALSKEFSTIYALQLVVNLVAVAAYVAYLLIFTPAYGVIPWIQLSYVISICFDVSWFFFGLEQFKITIIRNLIVKVLSLALIIALVRQPGDLWLYSLIMGGSTLASQLYLFAMLRRFVRFSRPCFEGAGRRLREIAVLFVPVVAYSIYRVLDKTMLGSLSSVTELGYFENAEKLVNIPIAVITALGTVMLPRMSNILANSNADYRGVIAGSMNLALMLACSMAFGLVVIADDVCPVLFGSGFENCAIVVRMLAITVICSAWSNVIRTQYLIPLSCDSVYVGSTLGAAVVNLCLNVILIPRMGAVGACVGTIAAEVFVAVYQTVAVWRELDMAEYLKRLVVHFGKAGLLASAAWVCANFIESTTGRLVLEIVVFAVGFCFFNWRFLRKDFFGCGGKG